MLYPCLRPPLPSMYLPSDFVPGLVPEIPQVKVMTCKPNSVLRYMTETQAKSVANTNTENFQHSACLASPEGNRTWSSWAPCCERCQYVGAHSLSCLSTPWEPPCCFLLAFQLPLTWILEALDLVTSTLEQKWQETEQHLVMWRPSFKFCIPSAVWTCMAPPFSCLLSGGGEERTRGDLSLYISAMTMVFEVQHRHWLSLRPPSFNHMRLSGDHCADDDWHKMGFQIIPLPLTLYESFCSWCWKLWHQPELWARHPAFTTRRKCKEAHALTFSLSCFLSWSKEDSSFCTLTAMLASTTKGLTHLPAAHELAHLQDK